MSGKQAIEMIQNRIKLSKNSADVSMYKLILLDYSLGDGLDGPDISKYIRWHVDQAKMSQPYICGCSAYDEPTYSMKALEAGMNEFISKPIKAETLQRLV